MYGQWMNINHLLLNKARSVLAISLLMIRKNLFRRTFSVDFSSKKGNWKIVQKEGTQLAHSFRGCVNSKNTT